MESAQVVSPRGRPARAPSAIIRLSHTDKARVIGVSTRGIQQIIQADAAKIRKTLNGYFFDERGDKQSASRQKLIVTVPASHPV